MSDSGRLAAGRRPEPGTCDAVTAIADISYILLLVSRAGALAHEFTQAGDGQQLYESPQSHALR